MEKSTESETETDLTQVKSSQGLNFNWRLYIPLSNANMFYEYLRFVFRNI